MCMTVLLLTCLHVHEFIVTTVVAGSVALRVRQRKRQARLQLRLPAPVCLLTSPNFKRAVGRRREGDK